MKKNVMMRLASFLLVAVLISTSAISGTYAKYVTQASGSDSARVAKWGVQVAIGGSSFDAKYNTDDTKTYSGSVSVQAENGKDLIVAPGTNGTGAQFVIAGKPEVATKISVAITGVEDGKDYKDIYLSKGTYTDYTVNLGQAEDSDSAVNYGTFTLEEDYYPIVWKVSLIKDASEGIEGEDNAKTIATGSLKAVVDELNKYVNSAVYAPNTDIGATFELSWSWAFDSNNNTNNQPTNDKADTLLGNLIAADNSDTAKNDAGIDNEESYSTEIAYKVTITVTQVD